MQKPLQRVSKLHAGSIVCLKKYFTALRIALFEGLPSLFTQSIIARIHNPEQRVVIHHDLLTLRRYALRSRFALHSATTRGE